ncbi:MAG: dienelactone hydrolase [Acidimicrobiales bacterium]|nr:MAG: dienelactone hydrolase [Acidimicrobiales bacterium]
MGETGLLDTFERTEFVHEGKTRDVFRLGSGPPVLVLSEMPGITPAVVAFARKVVERGMTAVLPHLFGVPGSPPTPLVYAKALLPACVSKEFAAFATGGSAPVTRWLRALARRECEVADVGRCGVVGMCWTGGFSLAMAVEPVVVAPVMSQPSLPLPVTARHRRDLHASADEIEAVKQRARDGLCIMGLRFTNDALVPSERFAHLKELLGDAFIAVEIDSSPGNPHGIRPRAHSVLTEDLVDEPGHPTHEALERVLSFLTERLVSESR